MWCQTGGRRLPTAPTVSVSVMQPSMQGVDVVDLAPDRVNHPAFHPANRRHTAQPGDVCGFGRPRRNRSQAGHHHDQMPVQRLPRHLGSIGKQLAQGLFLGRRNPAVGIQEMHKFPVEACVWGFPAGAQAKSGRSIQRGQRDRACGPWAHHAAGFQIGKRICARKISHTLSINPTRSRSCNRPCNRSWISDPPMPAQRARRFIESVGRKADVALYLRLFRAQKNGRFALLAVEKEALAGAFEAFLFDLRILVDLGLLPVVTLGLFDPAGAAENQQRVISWLDANGIPAVSLSLRADDGSDVHAPATEKPERGDPTAAGHAGIAIRARAAIADGKLPVIAFDQPGDRNNRFQTLEHLIGALESRKFILISTHNGIHRHGKRVSVINVNGTVGAQTAPNDDDGLSPHDRELVWRIGALLRQAPARTTASLTDGLNLLRELFSVAGAGTLFRRGLNIRHQTRVTP